jgi:hypothetical protein
MSPSLLLSGLLGGWLACDATALAQTLASQPLVGAGLAGLAWGDWTAGLRVGALLQLFALAGLPLGGRTPDDYAAAGVVGAGVAVALGEGAGAGPPVATVLAAVAGFAVAVGGRWVTRWARVQNEGLTRWLESELARGRAGALDVAHGLGVAQAFLVGAGFTLGSLALAILGARWLAGYDELGLERACAAVEPVLWGVGAGLTARQLLPASRPAVALFLAALAFLVALRLAGMR